MQKVIYGIGATLLLLIVVGFALPRTHTVEVSVEIDAHAATVFALTNDFQRFSLWSPWTTTDPDARIVYSGAARGVGASMAWDGTIIGSGTQTITASRSYEEIQIRMNPGEPGEASAWFRFAPGIGTTIATWGFETDHGMNIVGRYFASMLGGVVARDYNEGLAALKELAESMPRADFGDLDVEHVSVDAINIAYLPVTSKPGPDAVAEALGEAYFKILTFIDDNSLADGGAPLSIIRDFNGANIAYDAAIPIDAVAQDLPDVNTGVRMGKTYAGSVVRVQHLGSYQGLRATHRKISAYLAALGLARNGAAWESYVSDPGKVAERDLLTVIYYPVTKDKTSQSD